MTQGNPQAHRELISQPLMSDTVALVKYYISSWDSKPLLEKKKKEKKEDKTWR